MAPQAAAAQTVLDALAADQLGAAACRSAAGTGASSWLHEPTAPNHHLMDPQLCIALRTRLNLDLPSCTGRCQHRRQDGTACGHQLDAKGQHARSCAVGGWLLRRHNAACAVLSDWAEQQGCLVCREVVLPNSAPDRPEARMDMIIRPPGAGAIFVDLTVVSALTREAVNHGSARREIPALQRDPVCDRRSRPPWRRSHRLDQTTGADRSSQALQSHQASASVPRSCPPTACCRCRPRSHARHTSQSRVVLFSQCRGPLKLVLHFSCRQDCRGLFKVRYQ